MAIHKTHLLFHNHLLRKEEGTSLFPSTQTRPHPQMV